MYVLLGDLKVCHTYTILGQLTNTSLGTCSVAAFFLNQALVQKSEDLEDRTLKGFELADEARYVCTEWDSVSHFILPYCPCICVVLELLLRMYIYANCHTLCACV